MQSATVNIYEIGVIFDTDVQLFAFAGDVLPLPEGGAEIVLPPGVHVLNFTLTSVGGQATDRPAKFLQYPLQWANGDTVLGTPSSPTSWFNDFQCSAVVFNTLVSPRRAGLRLSVTWRDTLYTSTDPTIINEPGGGGQPAPAPQL